MSLKQERILYLELALIVRVTATALALTTTWFINEHSNIHLDWSND